MSVLLVVLLVLLAGYVVAASNRFARQRALVQESWRQVEVELQRRRDLVPALVAQVRAFEQHEGAVLRELAAAADAAQQAAAGPAGTDDVGPAEARLTRALGVLPVVATGPLQQLQDRLAETEDRIAAARRFHAAAVRRLDVRLQTFPSGLVARATGVERPDVPELTEWERADLELPPG